MLILTRRPNESIFLTTEGGERIKVSVTGVQGNQVRLGIDAPRSVTVHREEIQMQVDRESR